MTTNRTIFIEGIPGSGKTTLLNSLADRLPDYTVFCEGDISPVELVTNITEQMTIT